MTDLTARTARDGRGEYEKPEWAELLLRYCPERLMMGGEQLYLADPRGLWVSLGSGASKGLVHSILFGITGREQSIGTVADVRGRLSRLPVDYPQRIRWCMPEQLNRIPLVETTDGRILDLRHSEDGDRGMDAGLVRDCLTVQGTLPMIDYRPELWEPPWPPEVQEAVAKYGRVTFERLAYLLLGPHKAIDVIRIPTGNSGKSTLALWIQMALGGGAQVLDAYLQLNGQRFSELRRKLTTCSIVILDEADKIKSPPSIAHVNELTSDLLQVEEKYQPERQELRKGNVILIGADWPAIVTGQGADTRFEWVNNRTEAGVMSAELRGRLLTPDMAAWLGTYLVNTARQQYRRPHENGSHGLSDETTAAVQEFLDAAMDPVYRIMQDILREADASSRVGTAEILEAVRRHPLASELDNIDRLPSSRHWKGAITNAVPKATQKRTSHTRWWAGLETVPMVPEGTD